MKPDTGSTSREFWVTQMKERGPDFLEDKLLTCKGSRMGDAIELVLKQNDKKQEDIRNSPRDEREIEGHGIAQRTLGWTAVGVLIAVVVLAGTIYFDWLPKS